MRLGEIKNIIEKSINDSNQIVIDSKPIFNNQAYIINNYKILIDIFNIIWDLPWNDVNSDWICAVIDAYWEDKDSVQITAQEFNQLDSYFSQVNQKLPFYYSILESMTEKQDEQIINIKIPEKNVDSLDSLNEFNDRLDKLLKTFNIDWESYIFKWLDKWTSWYEILIVWYYTYIVFLACLKIAKAFFEAKEAYYKSEDAKLNYIASLKEKEKFTEKWYEEYLDKLTNLKIESKVKEALENLWIQDWIKGKKSPELQTHLVVATKELIKELGKWTEFHLSLNPPKYAEENWYSLQIDYKQISALIEEKNKPKWLENKQENEEDSKKSEEENKE